eukprot:4067943-Prymnesium_polylepis.1
MVLLEERGNRGRVLFYEPPREASEHGLGRGGLTCHVYLNHFAASPSFVVRLPTPPTCPSAQATRPNRCFAPIACSKSTFAWRLRNKRLSGFGTSRHEGNQEHTL